MSTVQNPRERFAIYYCIGVASLCAALHLATFLTFVPFWVLLPGFLLLAVCAILLNAAIFRRGFFRNARVTFIAPRGTVANISWALFLYALLLFAWVYRATGGANGLTIFNGHYVAMNKSHILQTLTLRQYRMYETWWVRTLSAWYVACALLCTAWLRTRKT